MPAIVRSVLASLACAPLMLTACGGQAPLSPSNTNTGSADSAGAVIAGVVTGTTGQTLASVKGEWPSSATIAASTGMNGLTVRVAGTNLSSTVADNGTFQIAGVPAGTVSLQFTSSAISAATAITNVSKDQFIEIQVQVGTTSAVVIAEQRTIKVSLCHAEGNGTYHAITVSESAVGSHRAHGDGQPGDPIPNQPLKSFDESCNVIGPEIRIEKTTNGEDAENAPGPSLLVGSTVTWQYLITNGGTVTLTGVAVSDDRGVSVNCHGKTSLAPATSMSCTGTGVATIGQYRNVGSVTANWVMGSRSGSVTDSDVSHYFGVLPTEDGDGPKITLCHKTGSGRYVTITVSTDAEPAHRNHGDGQVGEPVPGVTGKVFGAGCSVQ
jgi:hypothetical protein